MINSPHQWKQIWLNTSVFSKNSSAHLVISLRSVKEALQMNLSSVYIAEYTKQVKELSLTGVMWRKCILSLKDW